MSYTQLVENLIEAMPKPNEKVLELIHVYKIKAWNEGMNDADLIDSNLKASFLIELFELLDSDGFYTDEIKNKKYSDNRYIQFREEVAAMCKAANCYSQVLSSGLWITFRDELKSLEQKKIEIYVESLKDYV